MHKKSKPVLLVFVSFFTISIAMNIIISAKFDLFHIFSYRICRLFNASTKSLSKPYSEKDNKPIVYHLKNSLVQKIDQYSRGDSQEIPNHLIIQPGIYNFLGKNYFLKNEGLYRFLLPAKINAQRIVYQNDIDALLSAMSWIATHGNSDDKKSKLELSDKALYSKLFITCGSISSWANHLLTTLSVKSRLVAGMTVDEWNTYNNGHRLIEVWRDKWNKWVLYDLDNNSYFVDNVAGVPLSLIEFSQAVSNKNYEIIDLSSATRLDVSGFSSSDGYKFSFWSEAVNANISDWYARVMQVPLIYDELEKKYFFSNEKHKTRIESYESSYKFIEKTVFINRFYNSND